MISPALITPLKKFLFLAQKLVPSLLEFTINMMLFQLYQYVMSDSSQQITTLQQEIQHMENQIQMLLEEQINHQSQSQELQLQIAQLQERLAEGNSITPQLEEYYSKRLEFLDQRISNHQATLQKYKQYYQTLHATTGNHSQNSKNKNKYFSNKQQQDSFVVDLKNGVQINQSMVSMRSNSSRVNENDRKKSINVVCQVQCESCGGFFKPYRYYSHVNSCQKQSLINTKISSSVMLG